MVVVVSHPGDPHAARVIELLEGDGHHALLLDLSRLPGEGTLTMEHDGAGAPRLTLRDEGAAFDLGAARSVWWRRPQVPDTSVFSDHDVRVFSANEWQEAVNGLWQLIGAPWMNPPARDEVASRKALQLGVAAEIGLRVPRTVMTSDPDEARAFIAREGVGRTVYKTFSCTHAIWRETRLVGEHELANLDGVRLAPVIFQEYVPAEADLRITAVGDRLFAAAIHAGATDYPVDFRMSLGQARCAPATLPDAVADRLRGLLRRLGLVYGAIDMRLTPGGEHVFLEVNTAGEFLFVEDLTGQPISRAVADWLAAPA